MWRDPWNNPALRRGEVTRGVSVIPHAEGAYLSMPVIVKKDKSQVMAGGELAPVLIFSGINHGNALSEHLLTVYQQIGWFFLSNHPYLTNLCDEFFILCVYTTSHILRVMQHFFSYGKGAKPKGKQKYEKVLHVQRLGAKRTCDFLYSCGCQLNRQHPAAQFPGVHQGCRVAHWGELPADAAGWWWAGGHRQQDGGTSLSTNAAWPSCCLPGLWRCISDHACHG